MPAPRPGESTSACGVQPGLLEVEELRLPDAQRRHLVHLGLQLRWRLLAFAFAGLLLGREAGQRDEAAVFGHPGGRAQPARGTGRELLGPPVEGDPELSRVGYLSLNHL